MEKTKLRKNLQKKHVIDFKKYIFIIIIVNFLF